MGARGKLKLVPASDRPDIVATAAAKMAPKAPQMPQAVADREELAQLWGELVPQLDAAGLVSPADGPSLELAIRHFAAARRASDELADGGLMLWDAKNQRDMKSPLEVIFRSQSTAFLEYAKQLGLTFASRVRLPHGTEGADDDNENPFAPQTALGG